MTVCRNIIMRILIVDDELVSRKKLEAILSSFGETLAVEDGAEALRAFKLAWEEFRPFDLVCLDINMPMLSGKEVLVRIRALEEEMMLGRLARVKIVMTTAQSDPKSVTEAMKAGCDDYVIKPYNPGKIKMKISQLFADPWDVA